MKTLPERIYIHKDVNIEYATRIQVEPFKNCVEYQRMDLVSKIEELSQLSNETEGASFVIQYLKKTGTFKINFNNMGSIGCSLKAKAFISEAIEDAILWIKDRRKKLNVSEKYTLYKK